MYCIIYRRLLDSLPHHAGSGGEADVLPGIGCGSVWQGRPFGSLKLLPHCERLVGGQIIAIRMCVICLSVCRYSKLFLCCDCFCMYAFVAAKLIQKKFLAFCGSRTFWSIHILYTLYFLEPPLTNVTPSARNFQNVFPPFIQVFLLQLLPSHVATFLSHCPSWLISLYIFTSHDALNMQISQSSCFISIRYKCCS